MCAAPGLALRFSYFNSNAIEVSSALRVARSEAVASVLMGGTSLRPFNSARNVVSPRAAAAVHAKAASPKVPIAMRRCFISIPSCRCPYRSWDQARSRARCVQALPWSGHEHFTRTLEPRDVNELGERRSSMERKYWATAVAIALCGVASLAGARRDGEEE